MIAIVRRTAPLCLLALLAATAVLAISLRPAPADARLAAPLHLAPPPVPVPVPVPAVPAPVPAPPAAAPEPDWIPAYSDCTRPGADARGLLLRRVYAWIDRVRPGWRTDDSDPSVRFGCVDRGGIVLDVEIDDDVHPYPQRGSWWVLRVTSRAIHVLAGQTALARFEWDEDADARWVETAALADLDGDGIADPVILFEHREIGAMRGDQTLRVGGRRVGRTFGNIEVLGMRGGRLSIALDDGDDASIRCIGARGRWARC